MNYVTTSLGEIDKERIRETFELPAGAKCMVHYKRSYVDEDTGETIIEGEGDTIAKFLYMDGLYGRWEDENGESMIFSGLFKQISDDMFRLVTKEELGNS